MNTSIFDINVENVLLNLKMISQIKPYDKLYMEEDLIKIDTPTVFQGIYRWIKDYSRGNTAENLNVIIKNVIDITNSLLEQKQNNESNVLCQQILIEISNALKGLSNLKITYKDDTFMSSKLDICKEKLKARKDKLINLIKLTN